MADVIELTEGTFDSEVAEGVALVDFWAPWCAPCKLLHPVMESISKQMSGKAKVVRVNVDDNGAVANKFGIQSIPTVIILKNGKEVDRHVGLTEEKTLLNKVEKAI